MYKNNENVRHFIGMLDGLAFLRLNDINEGIQYLENLIPHGIPEMQELFSYFDCNYVRGPYVRQEPDPNINILALRRHPPLYPTELWNMFDITMSNEARTNNVCESFNNTFRQLVGQAHPSIWRAIKCFQMDSIENKSKILLSENGQPPRKKIKRVTEQLQNRLRGLCEDLREGRRTTIETLRAVGHTIVLARQF